MCDLGSRDDAVRGDVRQRHSVPIRLNILKAKGQIMVEAIDPVPAQGLLASNEFLPATTTRERCLIVIRSKQPLQCLLA